VIRETLTKLIQDALLSLGIEGKTFVVEHPQRLVFGDYSTNAGIVSGKAQEITDYLEQHKPLEIEKIEMKAGFINFYVSKDFIKDNLKEIIEKGSEFGKNNNLKGEKVMVEHTDPNPFKQLHIGHLMPMTVGMSIAHIFEWSGAEVKQACYQGDVGLHVAKAIYGMLKDAKEPYVFGTKAFDEDESAKKEIIEINKKVYDRSDEKINKLYDAGRKASLDYFDSVYKKLGLKFDYFFFESQTAQIGKEIVEKNIGAIFEKSDGATVFKAEKYDDHLHTRVFINSEGLPTYEAKELGLAKVKFETYPYTKSIVITGNEINDYFKVLLCAMKQIFPELALKTKHLSHGMLRLTTGKMSSRTGDVITAEALIDEVKEKVKGDEAVAIGAIKYMILRQSIGNDIIFDLEKSVSTEGDSGVYLQYAHARAQSLLEKAEVKASVAGYRKANHEIEKLLYRFPEIVERAMQEYAPHHITTYLTELAGSFNNFYAHEKVLEESDESAYRLAIVSAFKTVMHNGLTILGIPAPEKM
jgi:arginyl-tRNA synthetase